MKKLLLSISILICAFGLKAQYVPYPITQNLGNTTSTLVQTNTLKANQGIILGAFTDTTAANALPYLAYYTAAMIWSNSDSSIYVRFKGSTTQYWVKATSAAGGPGSGGWQVGGNFFPVAYPNMGLGTRSPDALQIITDNTLRASVPADGFAYVNDTTANKVMVWNPTTKAWNYSSWFGAGGGGSQTWQGTLTTGSTLTGANTIAGGDFDFTWSNMGNIFFNLNSTKDFNVESRYFSTQTQGWLNEVDDLAGGYGEFNHYGKDFTITASGSANGYGGLNVYSGAINTKRIVQLFSTSSGTMSAALGSEIEVRPDSVSINLRNTTGSLYIKNLASGASTDSVMVVNTTTNKVGYRNASAFSGGGSNYTLQADSLTQWGLDIRDYANVYHGLFYPVNTLFYKFFWQVLVRPYPGCVYWISDDYGGAHNILFGNDGSITGMMGVSGNIYYDLAQTSFDGYDVVPDSTDHFFAVGYDGANIVVFIDGVPSKATPYTGYRRRTGGSGDLWIGGSDHSKAIGLVYEVIGFEDVCPVGLGGHYYPQKGTMGSLPGCVFNSDYTTPTNLIADNSPGMLSAKHPGVRNAYGPLAVPAIGNYYAANTNQYGFYDSLKPQWVKANILPTSYSGPSPIIPGSAVAYEEFLESDRTPAWTNSVDINLDSTDGGTAGKKKWNKGNGTNICGTLSQHAWLDVTNGGYVYITGLGISNQDVRITRDYGDPSLQAYARWTDDNNWVKVISFSNGDLLLNKKVAGVETNITTVSSMPTMLTLRLVVSGATADVYLNGVIRITAASITGVPLGEGAGFGCVNDYGRVKKFEVY